MINTIEELLQDYARYSFMENTIDENTMNHLIEDAQNYVSRLNELKLLGIADVVKSVCDCERSKDIYRVEIYKCGKCHLKVRS